MDKDPDFYSIPKRLCVSLIPATWWWRYSEPREADLPESWGFRTYTHTSHAEGGTSDDILSGVRESVRFL